MFRTDEKIVEELRSVFKLHVTSLPVWVWLSWLPQVCFFYFGSFFKKPISILIF